MRWGVTLGLVELKLPKQPLFTQHNPNSTMRMRRRPLMFDIIYSRYNEAEGVWFSCFPIVVYPFGRELKSWVDLALLYP